MRLVIHRPGPPDLFVHTHDGRWAPAYRVEGDVVDGVARTGAVVCDPAGTDAVEFLSADRLSALADADRLLGYSPFVGLAPIIAVVDDTPRPSPRLVDLDEGPVHGPGGPSEWEKLRRLLNARCGQLRKHMGRPREFADEVRHRAAEGASAGQTTSSMDLSAGEMEDAVSYVEHLLGAVGFDLDAADAEYRARRGAALRRAA